MSARTRLLIATLLLAVAAGMAIVLGAVSSLLWLIVAIGFLGGSIAAARRL